MPAPTLVGSGFQWLFLSFDWYHAAKLCNRHRDRNELRAIEKSVQWRSVWVIVVCTELFALRTLPIYALSPKAKSFSIHNKARNRSIWERAELKVFGVAHAVKLNINFTNFHSHFLVATFFITSRVVNSCARRGIYEPFERLPVQPVSFRKPFRKKSCRQGNSKIKTFAFDSRVIRYSLEIRQLLRLRSKGLS